MRITLIHAMSPSIPPITQAFHRLWPEATLMNLLDDSLAPDLARDRALTPAMTDRFLALARYGKSTGSDAILFTCSAFGPSIEACAREFPSIPVLKPILLNQSAMVEQVVLQFVYHSWLVLRMDVLVVPGISEDLLGRVAHHLPDVLTDPIETEGFPIEYQSVQHRRAG